MKFKLFCLGWWRRRLTLTLTWGRIHHWLGTGQSVRDFSPGLQRGVWNLRCAKVITGVRTSWIVFWIYNLWSCALTFPWWHGVGGGAQGLCWHLENDWDSKSAGCGGSSSRSASDGTSFDGCTGDIVGKPFLQTQAELPAEGPQSPGASRTRIAITWLTAGVCVVCHNYSDATVYIKLHPWHPGAQR